MVKTLDIGCGNKPKGNVNIDLFPEQTLHRGVDANIPIDTRNILNFIKADMHHLPFRNNVFDKIISSHSLEHTNKPLSALKEMKRVLKKYGILMIKTPFWFMDKNPFHVHKVFFNKKIFVILFNNLNMQIRYIEYSSYKHIPHFCISIIRIPLEIKVIAQKGRVK